MNCTVDIYNNSLITDYKIYKSIELWKKYSWWFVSTSSFNMNTILPGAKFYYDFKCLKNKSKKALCCSRFTSVAQISPSVISPIQNFTLSFAQLFFSARLPFSFLYQIIYLIYTLSLLTKPLLLKFTQALSARLSKAFFKKTNNSVSFWDFPRQQHGRMAAHAS